jgi:hypothetical protein
VTYGYYWDGDDPLRRLAPAEERAVLGLALEGARRLEVPYVTIDVGQTEAGDWLIIESGDAQFAGIGQGSLFQLWQRLAELARV